MRRFLPPIPTELAAPRFSLAHGRRGRQKNGHQRLHQALAQHLEGLSGSQFFRRPVGDEPFQYGLMNEPKIAGFIAHQKAT